MSIRYSEEQYAAMLRRRGIPGSPPVVDTSVPPFLPPHNQAGMFALGRLKTGEMNKSEAAYAAYLETLKHAGEVLWWKFEGVKLRLADKTFLTMDFAVLPKSGLFELVDVKGYFMEDAKVKIKVAASIYPFKFAVVRKKKGGWDREEFS